MTYAWGWLSLRNKRSCRAELQELADRALMLSPFDLSCTDGHRGEIRQNAAYASGRTRTGPIVTNVQWPNGNHNAMPSNAIHLDPYPINYDDTSKYLVLIGIVWAAARSLELEDALGVAWLENLRNGRDWDHDSDYTDQKKLLAFAHWEWTG